MLLETMPFEENAVMTTSLSAEDRQILIQRREAVVQRMRDMTTFLWRTDADILYSKQRSSQGVENDDPKNVITLKAGRLYSGLPYTHGGCSIYDWQTFVTKRDENGVCHVSGITGEMLTGHDIWEPNRCARLGTDCADSVSWAWGAVSSSMDCTQTYEMNESHGCIPVGEFAHDASRHAHTIQVCQQNGMQVMFAAYAQLQPGDAVLHNNAPDGSHAMLVSKVHVAVKPNGEPDYDNSYICVVHQTSKNLFAEKSYYSEELGEQVYYCGGVDDRFMFSELFEKGYLPFTIQELIDPAPLAEAWVRDSVAEPTLNTMFAGKFTANYPISYVTVSVLDEAGKTVQQGTCFATESELKCFDLVHFTEEAEQKVMRGVLNVEQLPAGTYCCIFVCRLSTGKELTVRDFTFTVDAKAETVETLRVIDVRVHEGDSGFLLDDGQTAILLDSGFGFTGDRMAEKLRAQLGQRKLDYIFLTHSHYDHALGAAYILRHYPEAKVVAGAYAAKIFAKPTAKALMRKLDRAFADTCGEGEYADRADDLRVDIPVTEGDVIRAGDLEFEVLELPGHTRCSVGYYCRQEDLLLGCETPGVFDGEDGVVPAYLVGYQMALDAMARLRELRPARILCPHYGLLTREQTALYLEEAPRAARETAEDIVAALKAGKSKEEILAKYEEKIYHGHIREVSPVDAMRLNASIMVDLLEREFVGKAEAL